MNISPDQIVFGHWGFVTINATLVFTWMIMLVLGIGAWLVTRKLSTDTQLSHWQNLLEVLVVNLRDQIQQTSGQNPDRYLPFVGTLFVFIATSNLLAIVPGYQPPTASLSTTAALAICVFFSVPVFGISQQGIWKCGISIYRIRRNLLLCDRANSLVCQSILELCGQCDPQSRSLMKWRLTGLPSSRKSSTFLC